MDNTNDHRVGWEWYVMTIVIPLVGVIRGIIAAAKDKVGPALALWATSFLAFWAWTIIIAIIAASSIGNGGSYNPSIDFNEPSSSENFTDEDGYRCLYIETAYDDLCPNNPSSAQYGE